MSNFHPDTVGGGGLLFRFACSLVLRGGRGAADKYHWRAWGALALFRPHWVCRRSCRVLYLSTLLRLQAALQGAGPALRGLPRPKPLRFRFSGPPQKHRLGWACVLCRPCPSSSGLQEPDGRTLPRCGAPSPLRGPSLGFCTGPVRPVSILGSWPQAATLPADVDHPESQEVFG